ncbi:LGFP repeat protein [Corynebacterium occultum]|uniref:LGFP repeat protein n=1 Tax=Corynebacterium occultum TaxID=2675219 RepID=A0A6B8WCZ2_9CORY|nr:hypothetical protein [Corynebacterium occultum]QGU07860.1 LGFP repeat protein [Corynebacterium occultum]
MSFQATAERCQSFWLIPYKVCGEILNRYEQLGGATSWLLLPIEHQANNPDGQGHRQRFVGGFIYSHPEVGTHAVANHTVNVWQRHGWEAGWLGYPTHGEVPVQGSNSIDGEIHGWVQQFQGGRIYRSPAMEGFQVASINGVILDKWLELGGTNSELGFPIADEAKTADGVGRFSVFQNGSIYWHPNHGAHPLSGDILRQWSAAGYENGSLGYPIEDPVTTSPLSASQRFQGGYLSSPSIPVNLFGGQGNYSLGVPSLEESQASIEGASAVVENNDFRVALTPGGNFDINFDVTYKNPSTNPDFRFLVGLPEGLHLESRYTSRVSVVNTEGREVGAIVTPTSLPHSDSWVNIEPQVNGNEVTFHYAGTEPAQTMRTQAQAQNTETRASGVAVGDSVSNYVGINAGENETAVCANEPYDCARVYRSGVTDQAHAIGENTVSPPHDNEGDAARHCVWQGLTTDVSNAGFASRLAEAHERDNISDPNGVYTPAQTAGMDIYNNYTGRQVGIRLDGNPEAIKQVCVSYALAARVTKAPQNELPVGGTDLVILRSDLN